MFTYVLSQFRVESNTQNRYYIRRTLTEVPGFPLGPVGPFTPGSPYQIYSLYISLKLLVYSNSKTV